MTVHDRPEVLSLTEVNKLGQSYTTPVADPDFELRRGPGSILLAQPAFLPSAIFFFTQNKGGGGGGPPEPLPLIRHWTLVVCKCVFFLRLQRRSI